METAATNGCLSDDDDSYVESPRVLSIQSHVVSGYVGNKSAVFPLQVVDVTVLDHFPLRKKNDHPLTTKSSRCSPLGFGIRSGLYQFRAIFKSHRIFPFQRANSRC